MSGNNLRIPLSAGRAPARRAIREILFVAGLFLAYKLGRLLVEGHVGEAFDNAQNVWDFERLVHLPSEAALQAAVLNHTWLVRAANCFYAYVHFPATAAALIWTYLRRPEIYRWFRRTLASLTALALITHALFPLAPPRMLAAAGLIDTGQVYGPSVYGSPSTDTLSNQYAAMPSLHVGWALAVAIALIAASRSRWRWLWLAHPILTLLVVVVTGNHYWLDAIAAVTLLAVVLAIVTPLSRQPAPEAVVPQPTPQPTAQPTPQLVTAAAHRAGPGGAAAPAAPAGAPDAVAAEPPELVPAAPARFTHPFLAPCAQLAVLVPGAPLDAFLPQPTSLLRPDGSGPQPPDLRPQGAIPSPRAGKATLPVPPEPPRPRATLHPEANAGRGPGEVKAHVVASVSGRAEPGGGTAAACVPGQRSGGAAPSHPPVSPAATRPGPSAPRTRSAPGR